MRKTKKESEQTRRTIVETASREFRRSGIEGAGLADIMSSAGLTHGGFYRHFSSKNQLVAEAVALAADSIMERIIAASESKQGEDRLKAVASTYLSESHRENTALGCPLAALGSEMARADSNVREQAMGGYLKLVESVAKLYPQLEPEQAKQKAMAAVATMVGALTMARIAEDPALSSAILESAESYISEC